MYYKELLYTVHVNVSKTEKTNKNNHAARNKQIMINHATLQICHTEEVNIKKCIYFGGKDD